MTGAAAEQLPGAVPGQLLVSEGAGEPPSLANYISGRYSSAPEEEEVEVEQHEVARRRVTITAVKSAEGHSYEANTKLGVEVAAAGLERRYMMNFVREKWRSLPSPLPPDIHVWSYKKRADLMRAIIVGAPGTIFQDALFLFDFRIGLHYPMVPLEITFRSAFPGMHYLREVARVPQGTACNPLDLLNNYWTSPVHMELQMPVPVDLARVLDRRENLGETLLWLQNWIQSGHQFLWERGHTARYDASWDSHEMCVFMTLKAILHILQDPPKELSRFVRRYFLERRHRILHTYESCAWALGGFQHSLELRGHISNLLPALRAALPQAKRIKKDR